MRRCGRSCPPASTRTQRAPRRCWRRGRARSTGLPRASRPAARFLLTPSSIVAPARSRKLLLVHVLAIHPRRSVREHQDNISLALTREDRAWPVRTMADGQAACRRLSRRHTREAAPPSAPPFLSDARGGLGRRRRRRRHPGRRTARRSAPAATPGGQAAPSGPGAWPEGRRWTGGSRSQDRRWTPAG